MVEIVKTGAWMPHCNTILILNVKYGCVVYHLVKHGMLGFEYEYEV